MMGGDKKKVAAILGPLEEKPREAVPEALQAIVEELIQAIASHDVPGAAAALRAAFMECDSSPHVEGPHIED